MSLLLLFRVLLLVPLHTVTSHGLGPKRARIQAFVPENVALHHAQAQEGDKASNLLQGLGKFGLLSGSSSSGGVSGISITTTPSILQRSGDLIEVCVAHVGVGCNASTDFIAAYAPADADLQATAPIKLKYMSEGTTSPSLYATTGSGCVSFRLLNLRDTYKFALMRGPVSSPLLLATSGPVGFIQPNEVTGVHLALTDTQGEMSVTWVSRDTKAPVVQWWEASTQPVVVAAGGGTMSPQRFKKRNKEEEMEKKQQQKHSETPASTTTYTRQDLCTPPATTIGFHSPGQIHTAVMSGLVGGASYIYRVGDKELNVWSDPVKFTAPSFFPKRGGKEEEEVVEDVTYTFAVFGDMGTAEEDGSIQVEGEEVASLNTTRLLNQALSSSTSSSSSSSSTPPLSLVLHIGDLSYARGYDYQWDEFLHQNQAIMQVVPWMVSSGNHERDADDVSPFHPEPSFYRGDDSGGECGVPTQLRFPMPGPWKEAKEDQPWYSFKSGPVHWVVLCMELEFSPGSPQHAFLVETLSTRVNRTETPWVVMAAHRPLYIDSDWDDPAAPDSDQVVATLMQAHLEDVLKEHAVDLGLYGHHHSYQRTCQVYRNQCLAPSGDAFFHAPVHAVVGMAGQGLSQNAYPQRPAIFEFVDTNHFGLSLMRVNRTHLTLTLYSDEDGEVLDSFTLLSKQEQHQQQQVQQLTQQQL